MCRILVIALALLVTACAAAPQPEQPPADLGQLGPTTSENVGNAAAASAVWAGIAAAQRHP